MKILKNLLCTNLNFLSYGSLDLIIENLSEDTREKNINGIFFCKKGIHFDPHKNIDQIIKNGSICIISNLDPLTDKVTWIKTENLNKMIGEICYNFFDWKTKKKPILIGITGTNGKTSTSIFVKSILEQNNKLLIYIGTLGVIFKNYKFKTNNTTPSSLLINNYIKKFSEADYLVMEISSHGLVEDRIYKLPFKIVALTNISQDHLDFHKTMENYKKAKYSIFNINHEYGIINKEFYDNNIIKQNLITFGNQQSDYIFKNIILSRNVTIFDLLVNNKVFNIKTKLLGKFNIENITLAYAIINLLNFPIKDYNISFVPGRMNIISYNPLIINDFAHTPDALENILETSRYFSKKNLNLVFGCGGDRDKSKRKIMGQIANKFADNVIVTSDNPRNENPIDIINDIGLNNNIIDRKDSKKKIINISNKDDTILITGKGDEDYIIFGNKKYHYSDEKEVLINNKFLNKKILIVGSGISGKSSYDLLKDFTNDIEFYKENLNIKKFDYIVTSPGIKPSHKIFKNENIINEIEVAYNLYSLVKWVGITGTNGKTTTVSILSKIFKNIVGNIGIPCSSLSKYIEYNEPIVAELSSFQLYTIKDFKPYIGVILNITPDHIDYHGTFEAYKQAKFNITKNQTHNDYLILPFTKWAFDLKTKAKKIYFGKKLENNCIYFDNNYIKLKINNIHHELFIKKINLIGNHNKDNILVAYCIVYLFNKKNYLSVISNFQPLEHRLELVKEINGIKYVNDSKSTTIDSTIKALNSFNNPIILLMGGDTKGLNPFVDIFNYIKKNNSNVKKIICYGKSNELVKNISFENKILFNTLNESIQYAKINAVKGDIILLSPACASFDQFKNYKERGNNFKNIILKHNTL